MYFKHMMKSKDRIEVNSTTEFLFEPIFLNDKLKIGNEASNNKDWMRRKVYIVKNVVNYNGQFVNI